MLSVTGTQIPVGKSQSVIDFNKRKSSWGTYLDQDWDWNHESEGALGSAPATLSSHHGSVTDPWPLISSQQRFTHCHRLAVTLALWSERLETALETSLLISRGEYGNVNSMVRTPPRESISRIHRVSSASLKIWVLCSCPANQATLNVALENMLWFLSVASSSGGFPSPEEEKVWLYTSLTCKNYYYR